MDVAWADDSTPLSRAFADQADAAERAGSALWADICRRASDDLAGGVGELATVLAAWDPTRAGDLMPLRVLAAAHRLALERVALRLALFLPTMGGTAPVDVAAQEAAYAAFVEALASNRHRLPTLLAHPPQTNEIGRGAALLGALTYVQSRFGGAVRLVELGASGGLNLRADLIRVDAPGISVGPADSEVVLESAWQVEDGADFPPRDVPSVVERLGVDLAPVDVDSTEGRLHLSSFVWPDQVERFDRLAAAFRQAGSTPVEVHVGDLVAFVEGLPAVNHVTVIWHSAVWWYLPADVQRAAVAAVEALARRSSGPVVEVALEVAESRDDGEFTVAVRSWPSWSGEEAGDWVVLGHAPPHGIPVTWGWPRALVSDLA